jgi:septal ring factor EnvC (AmiA/AmiB activator)
MTLSPVNTVLVFNIALSILCLVQWSRETRLHADLARVGAEDNKKAESIQKLEGTVAKWEKEIARLDSRVLELQAQDTTNTAQIGNLNRELKRSENAKYALEKQVTAYKDAVANQNENIKAQNESIAKQNQIIRDQNDSLKKVAEERNQLVTVVNERTTALNDTINKFNTFVAQVEQSQAAAKAAAEKK